MNYVKEAFFNLGYDEAEPDVIFIDDYDADSNAYYRYDVSKYEGMSLEDAIENLNIVKTPEFEEYLNDIIEEEALYQQYEYDGGDSHAFQEDYRKIRKDLTESMQKVEDKVYDELMLTKLNMDAGKDS